MINLCHFSINHLVWLVWCVDYSNVMIVINSIEFNQINGAVVLSCFNFMVLAGFICTCIWIDGWKLNDRIHTINMVVVSIHLELISIFTFNYWKHNLRSRLQYIGVYINMTGGGALIFQCQTSCQRYAGSKKKNR